jgi:hypothetical protein
MPREPEGSAPAIIRSHPFEPRAQWWTVCKFCGLAEAAHADTVLIQRRHVAALRNGRPA